MKLRQTVPGAVVGWIDACGFRDALRFTEEWQAAWNSHDVDRNGHAVSEVLRIRDGLVCWGCGAYVPGISLAGTRSLDR